MKKWLSIIVLVFTAACGAVPEEQLAADGKPLPKFYDLSKVDAATLQFRMLDAVNALRSSAGLNQITLNAELTAAAATHSRDMALQNRPWHFGSDGSSPLDRAKRVGYENQFLGETISETYESEILTLAAWIKDDATRFILMDQGATEMGFSWFQEPNGKIWWTLVTGGPMLSSRDVTAE